MSIAKKLISQTLTYGFSSVIGRMLNYLLVPIHTYFFANPSDFGIITELYAYAAFLNILLTYGMETAFFRQSNAGPYSSTVLFNRFYTFMLVTTSLFVLVSVSSLSGILNWLKYPSSYTPLILVLVFILATDALSALPFAKLRQLEKTKTFALLKMVNICLNILFNLIFLIVFEPDVFSILLANLLANLTVLIILFWLNRDFTLSWNFPLFKQTLYYSFPLMLMGLAGMANEVLDRLLIKSWLPDSFYPDLSTMDALGIYGACYKLSIFMTLAIQSFRYAAEPFFFKISSHKNATEIYALIMNWFVLIGCLIFLIISIWLDVLQLILRTPIYRQGINIVPILLLANLFLGIYNNLSFWFKQKGNTWFGFAFTGFGALITLTANYLLIPKMGYLGAAYATLLCYSSMTVVCAIFGQIYYPIPYRFARILLLILLAVVLLGTTELGYFKTTLGWVFTHFFIPFLFLVVSLYPERKLLINIMRK